MIRSLSNSAEEVNEAEPSFELDSRTTSQDLVFQCSSSDLREREDENKKMNHLSSLEMDRTCLRPLNTDDIISKELPSEIFDTDFAEKDEDNISSPTESQPNDIPMRRDPERHEKNADDLNQECENSREEQFKADILEQDTGYSSDAAENVKNVRNENDESRETELGVTVKPSSHSANESTESVVNTVNHVEGEIDDAPKSDLPISRSNEEKSVNLRDDNFVPTIVGIRGSCDSQVPNETPPVAKCEEVEPPSSQQINIGDVQGNHEKPSKSTDENNENSEDDIIVGDTLNSDDNLPSSYNADLDIKEEPPENADSNDCVFEGTQEADACFTSEIFIEEDKSNSNENVEEEEEVVYIESSGKIPLPIPIKTEAHIDCQEQLETTKSHPISKENRNANLPVVQDPTVFTSVGYTCHLCNTTFQEHELLNDHMQLHRNNLVDAKVINKLKQKTIKHTCPICKRQLSTLQSLQQHVMIHNDDKPYVCKICRKDFRHQSNYRMHMQKHDAERAKLRYIAPAPPPGSVPAVRPLDFGKLIGPFYANVGNRANPPKTLLPTPPSFHRDNAKENVNILHRSLVYKNRAGEVMTRTRCTDEPDDDVIPLKTFSKVENIVMNAARFIVKVDSIDPSVLKKRIKTPDISIDKNTIASNSRRIGEKRKIVLSSSDNNKRLKLDQIENIIMDVENESDHAQPDLTDENDDRDYDYDFGNEDTSADADSDGPELGRSVGNHSEFFTSSKLSALLNNNRGSGDRIKTHNDYVSELRRNAQMILKSEAEKSRNSRPVKSSNVIMLKCPSKETTSSTALAHQNTLSKLSISETPYESYSSDNSDDEVSAANDSFDTVFHKVALRRLLLIQKRAAQNDGKIDSKYLLGPRFWRKALRRAKLKPVDFDVNTVSSSIPWQSSNSSSMDEFDRLDERHTNDPKRLQIRAENKLSCMLDKVRLSSNMNNMNLIGPLFWKRTLQLAGIHKPRDLSTLLSKERVSLKDVEFVDDAPWITEGKKSTPAENNADVSTALNNSNNNTQVSDLLHTDSEMKNEDGERTVGDCDSSKLVDSILSDVALQPSADQSNKSNSLVKASKSNSILYNSLTRPRNVPSKQTIVESPAILSPSVMTNTEETKIEKDVKVNDVEASAAVVNISEAEAGEAKEEPADNAGQTNITLNVDEGFQLIASDGDKLGEIADGANYVLVSDETGAMQLVKENDLRLVEGNDASGEAQYVVNLQGENFAIPELMGQVNGGEQQLTYALQFDGENYTAIQFVQNDVAEAEKILEAGGDGVDEGHLVLKPVEGENVIPNVTTDINNIGKELSDFLNLNYGTLTKDENE